MKIRIKNLKGAYIELSLRATKKQITIFNKNMKINRTISQTPVHNKRSKISLLSPTGSDLKDAPNGFFRDGDIEQVPKKEVEAVASIDAIKELEEKYSQLLLEKDNIIGQ